MDSIYGQKFAGIYHLISTRRDKGMKSKITVLKTTLDKELAKEYGAERFDCVPHVKRRAGILC